jgi:Primase C terminal 2 (PriCT-2)/Protein of unknown function (DUF3987)
VISRKQLEALANQLDPPQPPPPRGNQHNSGFKTYTLDEIADALKFIGDVDDRTRWLTAGMALKAEFGESGRPLWDAWSQASGKYDATDQEKNWRSFKADGGITIGSLIKFAKDGGWVPPRRARVVVHPTAAPRRKPDNQPVDSLDTKKASPFPECCIRGTAKEWIDTLEPRGEWPRAFLFAEWRQIHAMLMGRNVGFGSAKPRFAHCHDMLIGESGISHKNTSIHRGVDIIRAIRPNVLICNNVSSIEGVLDQMAPHKVNKQTISQPIGLIAAGEYSYLVASQQRQATSNIIPVLNDAYDGVDPLTITRRNAPIVHGSFLNLMTGATPSWINDYADKEGADLGRFNRCLIFYADQDRDIPRAKHLAPVERERFAKMFDERVSRVAAQMPNQLAVVEFTSDAAKFYEEWFFKHRARLRGLPDNLRKLLERNEDQVQIQSLIYAVADARRESTKDDLEAAIALVEWNQQNKLQLFAEVEFSADERLERLIHRFIDHGGGTLKQLYGYLGSKRMSAEAVHRKLRSFVALGFCTLSRDLDEGGAGPLEIFPPDPTINSQGSQTI